MNRDIRVTFGNRNFEFLDEQSFATNFLQAAIQNLVTPRRQRHEFDVTDLIQSLQQFGDMLGLPERQRTLASCNANLQGGSASF